MKRIARSLALPLFVLIGLTAVFFWSAQQAPTNQAHRDPICNMDVGEARAWSWASKNYYFCSQACLEEFSAEPAKFVGSTPCPVCTVENPEQAKSADPRYESHWQEKVFHFCSSEHRDAFRADPGGFFLHTMMGIPPWLYYSSIAFVLFISFGIFEWAERKTQSTPIRFDLMEISFFRRLIKHPYTRFVCRLAVMALFVLTIAAGLFGNQIPQRNIAPLMTWTIWWGSLVWIVLYAGKAWCYFCPWEAIADWTEGMRLWGPKKGSQSLKMKWPKALRNIWPATFLFIALTWAELGFELTMKPRVTAWMGLGMLALAFVCAFLFERRGFCRYGCLVGRISGLYSLFAPVEVRAKDQSVCRTCPTKSCFKGNELGDPCPTFQFVASMEQNTYCISCMECVKSCESDNVAVNLRAWGEDLMKERKPRSDEAYLALIMLSLTAFHGLTMTAKWQAVLEWLGGFGLGKNLAFSVGMLALMIAPVLVYAALVAVSWGISGESGAKSYKKYFFRYAYALLPIALFYHLAHNAEHLFMEGQKLVALASDPFGWGWNLFGTAEWNLAPLVDLSTLWLIQVFFVLVGHVYSLKVASKEARTIFGSSKAAFRSQVPMLLAMVAFSVFSLWLLKQPMLMRTSIM